MVEEITVTDRNKRDPPLSVGNFVYVRKRILGHNKIQDVWQPDLYCVTARLPHKHLYKLLPLAGGPERTVNRADLLLAEAPLSDLVPRSDACPTNTPAESDSDEDYPMICYRARPRGALVDSHTVDEANLPPQTPQRRSARLASRVNHSRAHASLDENTECHYEVPHEQ